MGAKLLSLFAVPLGLAGLGGVWQTMRVTVSAPAWPAETVFALCGLVWLGLTVGFLISIARAGDGLRDELRQAVQGPFAAFIPVVGILLSSHYVPYLGDAARVVVLLLVLAAAALVCLLVTHWLHGGVPTATFHPGFFLPTVAGAFISSIGLSFSGWHEAALAAFGIGVFFWLVIGTLVFGRLFTGPALPDPMKPTLAVLVSPPATAGIAWFVIVGGRMDQVGYLLLGILAMMLAIQVLLLPEYQRLAFGPGFWNFTFPAAASANVAIRWVAATGSAQAWSWSVAGLVTAFISAIAAVGVARAKSISVHRSGRESDQ